MVVAAAFIITINIIIIVAIAITLHVVIIAANDWAIAIDLILSSYYQ